jgi:hypothetical protein
MNREGSSMLLVEEDPSMPVKPLYSTRFAAMMETLGDYWLTWRECPR